MCCDCSLPDFEFCFNSQKNKNEGGRICQFCTYYHRRRTPSTSRNGYKADKSDPGIRQPLTSCQKRDPSAEQPYHY